MNKVIPFLLLIPFAAILPGTGGGFQKISIILDTVYIGPYEKGAPDVSLTISYLSNVDDYDVQEKIAFGSRPDDYSYFSETAKHSIFQDKTYKATLKLPLKYYLSEDNFLRIQIGREGRFLVNDSLYFTLKQSGEYDVTDGSVNKIIIENTIIQSGISGFKPIDEEFYFNSIYSYFLTDTYFRLPLQQFYFEYSGPLPFQYQNAYLMYNDRNNLFPSLRNKQTGLVEVPLEVTYENKKCTFSYKDIMYVEPKTLQMSLVEKEEFLETRYFYLPRNHKDDLLDEQFEIVVNGAGRNEQKIIMKPKLLAESNLIGDCSTSDYCIEGGVR